MGRKGHECQAAVGRPCHQVAFIRIPGVITLGSAGISNPGSDGNRVRSAPFPFENRRYGGRTIQETFARGDIHTPLQGQGVAVVGFLGACGDMPLSHIVQNRRNTAEGISLGAHTLHTQEKPD